MIVMCAPLSRSLRGRPAREGHTMPERRAHEPVPVAREHMSLTVHRANTMPERRAHEPVPEAREHTTCPCPGHCPHMSLTGPIMRRLPCQVVSHRVWPVSIRDAQTHTPSSPNNLYPQNVISLANREPPGPRPPRLRRIRPSGAVLDSCSCDVPRLSRLDCSAEDSLPCEMRWSGREGDSSPFSVAFARSA